MRRSNKEGGPLSVPVHGSSFAEKKFYLPISSTWRKKSSSQSLKRRPFDEAKGEAATGRLKAWREKKLDNAH